MSADAEALLLGVFASPSSLRLSDIDQQRTREARAAAPLIARFRRDVEAPVLLPSCRSDGQVRWYGLARSAATARLFAEQLLAFIGPTYTNFLGAAADLDLNDSVERTIADFVQGLAFALDVEAGHEADVCQQISLLAHVITERPLGNTTMRRTVEAALRDLDVALQVRDADGSEALLGELTSLGAHNVLFLRVRRLAALDRWHELLALPHLATVLATRRPQAVTRDLIRAIYAVHLAHFEDPAQPTAALRHFQENVRESFAPLLTAWGGMRDPAVLKTFMLLAATDRDTAFRDALLAAAPEGTELAPLLRLAGLVDGAPVAITDPIREARELIDAFRFDAAWQILQSTEVSRAVVALMISCALEFRNVATAAATLAALDALTDADRDLLLRSRVIALQVDALREQHGDSGSADSATAVVPSPESMAGGAEAIVDASGGSAAVTEPAVTPRLSGWLEWLVRVDGGWSRQSALKVARAGATEWPLGTLAGDRDALGAFIEALSAERSSAATVTLRMAAPSLIEALGLLDHPELVPLYLDLALLLRLSEGFTANDMVLVDDLAQRALRAGVDASTYKSIVDDYLDVWEEHGSPHRFDWLLDAIDTLLAVSSATQDGAERLFVAALGWCGHPRHRSRVESHQCAALRSLAKDLERVADVEALVSGDAATDDNDVAPAAAIGPLTVGVYTLQVRAGAAAQALIEARYPRVSVTVRHDKTNSTALEQLANGADVFILTWQAAKHAATDAITAARPKDRPVVYAAGTGRSSIIRAFEIAVGVN